MSLIINMLKDLDQRQGHAAPTPILVNSPQHHPKSSRDLYAKAFVVLSVLIFISSLAYIGFQQKSAHKLAPFPQDSIVNKSLANGENADTTFLKPVTISGVSFETKTDVTEITFLLTQETLYRLTHDEKNHVLNLYIDNASMESDLPTLIGADIPIRNITAVTAKDSMKFSIALKPDSYLKSVNLIKDGKSPELIIAVSNPPPPTSAEPVKIASGIKSPAIQSIIIEQYQTAVKLAETGNKQEAIAGLTKLLGYYPDYDDARVALAAITLENGNAVQARKIIDDGLAMSPDYLPLLELKARLLTSEGKIKEAFMVLQSEQPSINEAPGWHALIAALYNRQNNYLAASNIYQKLVTINPHEGSWWFGLGVSLDKQGKSQDAVFAYTKAATEGRISAQAVAFLQSRLQILQDTNHA